MGEGESECLLGRGGGGAKSFGPTISHVVAPLLVINGQSIINHSLEFCILS